VACRIVLPYGRAASLEAKIDIEGALVRAKAGSRTGFSDLVSEHQSLVFSVAYHFLQNSALAEEIAQDIFLDLYRNIGKIESAAHLTFWLRRSTTNRCIDQSRKLAYRTEVPISDTLHPVARSDGRDMLLGESVRLQVAKLPEWQRAIVILRYQEDLDPVEIANLLNLPVNTVKSRLYRALGTLREALERKKRVRA
jgi:RNA polymerase sigma-70 factor (ECF subfamily)